MYTAAEGGGEETSEVFCLVTDLLDVEEYPSLDLACADPDHFGLALATFLLKILMPGFAVRDCPDRASPGKPRSRRLPRPQAWRARRHREPMAKFTAKITSASRRSVHRYLNRPVDWGLGLVSVSCGDLGQARRSLHYFLASKAH